LTPRSSRRTRREGTNLSIERNWKKSFDPDFDENGQSKAVETTGLTGKQKAWLVRAWSFVFGEVPNAMPEEEAETPEPQRARGKRNWHHVYPQGASIRLAANDPDRPENIIPLDEFNHTGRGLIGEVDSTSPIVHQDDTWAHRHYRPNQKPSSYEVVNEARRHRTDRGKNYWNETYDGFFGWLASLVVGKYKQACPEDEWPNRKSRRSKMVWDEELMSWISKE